VSTRGLKNELIAKDESRVGCGKWVEGTGDWVLGTGKKIVLSNEF